MYYEGFNTYSEKSAILRSLCFGLLEKLEDSDIPEAEAWHYYNYTLTDDSVKLSLYQCTDLEFDEDDEVDGMIVNEIKIIAEEKCDYIPVGTFASQYKVTKETVLRWIRSG